MPIEIGKRYLHKMKYLPDGGDYESHDNVPVTVIKLNELGCERMHKIRADDGWEGAAWEEELLPLPDEEAVYFNVCNDDDGYMHMSRTPRTLAQALHVKEGVHPSRKAFIVKRIEE